MAPLTQAVRTRFVEERGEVRVYCGEVDKVWTFIAVPHGGYALGLIVDACVSSQARGTHVDIVHLSANFFRTTSLGYSEVHIRTVRVGKSYSNLSAEFVQKDELKIAAQLIFKAPSGVEDVGSYLTLMPSSPYARRVPLHLHPSAAPLTPMFPFAEFKRHIRWAEDKAIRERNRAMARGRGSAIGGGGLEWGAWLELIDPAENVNVATLPFVGDMMKGLPNLLPKDQRPPPSWNPTMVFSLEYKAKIPDDPMYAKRTVGLYSSGRFMHGGRHDVYVEIWTAPAEIGEGVEVEGWREKQVCLGIAHQMALTTPPFVNERKAAQANGKL